METSSIKTDIRKMRERLLNLQFNDIRTLPWSENGSISAGLVLLFPNGEPVLIGHDIQGSTSAHFIGGLPWKEQLTEDSGVKWAWVFNE